VRLAVLALVMAAHGVGAAETVVISALRHPVDKSYRKMVAGMSKSRTLP